MADNAKDDAAPLEPSAAPATTPMGSSRSDTQPSFGQQLPNTLPTRLTPQPQLHLSDHQVDLRTMVVGPETSFSGRISGCNRLIVDGSVDATLDSCRHVVVNDKGVFKGDVITENADVRGAVEGTLTVSKRLLIRTTGRVFGNISYEEIEIESGGKIFGSIRAYEPGAKNEARAPAAKALRVDRGARKSAKARDLKLD
jgi:cytoskeletal protein CcmA (bactofilin family)